MKLLDDIPAFPKHAREILEGQYGIESAEALYAHAVNDPEGLREALGVPQAEVDRLVKIVEGHLSPDYIERCRRALTRHPRGLNIKCG
jgi:hypothetical protein